MGGVVSSSKKKKEILKYEVLQASYSYVEAAAVLGFHRTTVQKYVNKGLIKTFTIASSRPRISAKELIRFIETME